MQLVATTTWRYWEGGQSEVEGIRVVLPEETKSANKTLSLKPNKLLGLSTLLKI